MPLVGTRAFAVAAMALVGAGNLALLALAAWLLQRRLRGERRHAEELANSRNMLQLVLDNVPQRIFWKDRASRFLGGNRPWAADLGAAQPQALVGRFDREFIPARAAERLHADDREVMRSGVPKIGYEECVPLPDGRMLWRRTNKVPLRDASGAVVGVLGTYEDVSERRQFESQLRLQQRAIEASVNAIMITGHGSGDAPIVYVNPAFERITGYAADQACGRGSAFLVGDDDRQPGVERIREASRAEQADTVMLRMYRQDGAMFWCELHLAPVREPEGRVTHYVSVFSDITESHRYQQQLEHQATHDALTGLPNRVLLTDRLNQALLSAQRDGGQVTAVVVDLDAFKDVNDAVGHDVGDRLLQAVAQRLRGCVRASDTVARFGADEFVLVLPGQGGDRPVAAELQRLLQALTREPMHVDGREFFVTASMGASVGPQDGHDARTLLHRADLAMHRAKAQGRNFFQCYDTSMNERLGDRLQMLAGLHHALERGEFVLHYQPRVHAASGRIAGVEALLRWNSPERGLVSPGEFIPLVEESGLIDQIGRWVLHAACAQAQAWARAGVPRVQMAVNLSARQFRREGLVAMVAQALDETGLPPAWLELELTESTLMHQPEAATVTLHELKALGVLLAIDDFGTGYSSLAYLKRFPVDHLKIDRSFVSECTSRADDAAIARTVIALARSLQMKTVAEGVETEEQAAFLRRERCDEIQGFLFSRPLPAAACEPLLRAQVLSP